MEIKVLLDEGAYMPEKAHEADAGFDLRAIKGYDIYPRSSVAIDTGVHIEIPFGYVGMLKSKSGLNVKYGIRSEGVIDSGYTGSIVAKLYNDSDIGYRVNPGDKITQIVFLPIPEVELVKVKEIDVKSERGSNGFGSSGR